MKKTAIAVGFYVLGGVFVSLNAQIVVEGYMTVHLCTPGEYEGINIGFNEYGNTNSPFSGNNTGGFCFDDVLKLESGPTGPVGVGDILFPEGVAAVSGNPPLFFLPPWFTATVGTVNIEYNTSPQLNDNSDMGSGGPPCSGCCVSGSSGDPGGTTLDSAADSTSDGIGMPVWRVSEPYLSLWLYDEPLGYQPSIGSRISFKLGYKQREVNAGMNPKIFGVGPKWNFSWLSYVTLDPFGSNIVNFPGGGAVVFEGPYDYLTNTRLTGNMTNGFNLYYPDGSTGIYGCIVNNKAFLTQHLDPRSQATAFNYQTNSSGVIQLQSVVDGSGGTNFVYYQATNQYSTNLITQVTDRYGRSAYFSYNTTNGCLTNITDVGGIASSLFYDTNFWVTNLQTPYGSTGFSLLDTPATNVPPNGRSVLVMDPDGSAELYLARDSAPGVAASYTNVPSTSPLTNTFDNTNLNVRNTFHWGKKQFADLSTTNIPNLTSNDFAKGWMKHWLLTAAGAIGSTLSLQRDPSPDPGGAVAGELVWSDYAGKTNSQYEGSQVLPLVQGKILPDGTTAFTWTARNTIGAVTTNINTYSAGSATGLRTNILTYSTNAIDLLTLTNALNVQVSSNAYNANHQVLTNYDALNEKTVFTYDANQRLTSATTPALLVITNIYGADGYLARKMAVGFKTNAYIYSNGLVYSQTDSRNLTCTNTWDALQRLTSRTFPDGTCFSNCYTLLDCTAAKDRLGNWTYCGYDQLRRNIAMTNALGNYALYNYCLCGALESMRDALGNFTDYYYDNQSRLTNVIYPDGYTVTNAYSLVGRLTNVTDGAGVSVTNGFNNQGLLTGSSNSAGQLIAISYDVLDRMTNMVDANGVVIGESYDYLNRLVTQSYPDHGTNRFGYSVFGLTAYTNQLTNVTYYGYDATKRKITETNALAKVTQYSYDPGSDLIGLTDQNNNITQWGYDQYGRVTNKVDATGANILTYKYDANSRLTNRWSLAKGSTSYAYDGVGNLTNVTYPTNHMLLFTYNPMNWQISMSDAIGTTSFGYTPTGQLAYETGPWAAATITYTYSNRQRTGLDLQQPGASDLIQHYTYDKANRMSSVTSPAGLFTYAFNSGLAGATASSALIASVALPNGAWITNTYDNNGRMLGTWLTNSAGNLDSSVYTYNVGNQRTMMTRTGENAAAYTYDSIGEVVADQASEISGGAARLTEQLQYAFDAAGNLAYRTNNTLTEKFQVNTLNELTANTNGGKLTVIGTTTSTATSVTVNGTNALRYGDATFAATNMPLTTTYTAIAADSYGRHSTNAVTVSLATNTAFQYDGNGNLTNDGLRSFAYDDENQLIQVWAPNQWFSQFTYDGKMRRRIRQEYAWQSSRWVQTNEVYYVYDGNEVIQERNINNLPVATYTRGQDLSGSLEGAGGIGGLLSLTLNTAPGPSISNSMYYHTDGNGNVTALINPSQYIVAKYLYDAFGNLLSAAGSLAQINLYRFSSKEAHLNSGLSYYLYRCYDPNLQRWVSRDPNLESGFEAIRHSGRETKLSPRRHAEANLYNFVSNRATTARDAFGLIALVDRCQEAKDALADVAEKALEEKDLYGNPTEETLAELLQGAEVVVAACKDPPPGSPPDGLCPDPGPRMPPLDPTQHHQTFCQAHPTICHVGIGVGVTVVAGVGIAILVGSGGTAAPLLAPVLAL